MIATTKMIVLLLVTTLLLNYSLGNTESESVEAVDVAKQGILKSADAEGHIESAELDDAIEGDWRSEFEQLIATHSSLLRPQLARTVCQEMYTKYPDITWVVLVYEPVTGSDVHQVAANSQTHLVFRHHGHNAIISRYAGAAITSDFGLETSLYASFTPSCYKYCHDPACWNSYYHVNAQQTLLDTWSKVSNSISQFMMFTLQDRYSLDNFAGRKDSSTGLINGGPVFGTCTWDTRVVESKIKTTCDNKSIQMMILGVKRG